MYTLVLFTAVVRKDLWICFSTCHCLIECAVDDIGLNQQPLHPLGQLPGKKKKKTVTISSKAFDLMKP